MPEGQPGALRNQVAFITGAARGMGAACGVSLGEQGVNLILFDADEDALEATGQQLAERGFRCFVCAGNIANAADVERAANEAIRRFGQLDILVNAAGQLKPTRVFDISLQEWQSLLETNLTGAFLVSVAAARQMRTRRYGRIVHFSSSAGKTVSTLGGCHYTAAKHGVLGLTRALAKELAPLGITVNAVCPGLIDTAMIRTQKTEGQLADIASSFPINRLGRPSEVAALVSFLVGADSGYITGAAIDINGGDLMV